MSKITDDIHKVLLFKCFFPSVSKMTDHDFLERGIIIIVGFLECLLVPSVGKITDQIPKVLLLDRKMGDSCDSHWCGLFFVCRGLINDQLYAETFSQSRWTSSSWGPRRIKHVSFLFLDNFFPFFDLIVCDGALISLWRILEKFSPCLLSKYVST